MTGVIRPQRGEPPAKQQLPAIHESKRELFDTVTEKNDPARPSLAEMQIYSEVPEPRGNGESACGGGASSQVESGGGMC